MKTKYKFIYIIVLFLISCEDERNRPVLNGAQQYELGVNMGGPTRDFVIVENFSAENFYYYTQGNVQKPIKHKCTDPINPSGFFQDGDSCDDSYWCEFSGGVCRYVERDLLIVSNREDGLFVYEIQDGSEPFLVEIYQNINIEDPTLSDVVDTHIRDIYYSPSHNTIYMLDEWEFIYPLYLPSLLSTQNENTCDGQISSTQLGFLPGCAQQFQHASKFTINENNIYDDSDDFGYEMFVLYKHNENTGDLLNEGEEYSDIYRINYTYNPAVDGCDLAAYVDDCDKTTLIDNNIDWNQDFSFNDPFRFNYGVTDIYFDNNKLFIANPSNEHFSYSLYNYNPFMQKFQYGDEYLTSHKVRTVFAYGDYVVSGMSDVGCYITLLNQYGISDNINDKLHVVDGVSVFDIKYDDESNYLLLSCGADGVFVFNWDGESLGASFSFQINSSYAYVANVYGNKVIVGTENGLEVFNLGE